MDSGVFESGRVFCRQAQRSGWGRAGLYKKVEHITEAFAVVQVHHSACHLFGFFCGALEVL